MILEMKTEFAPSILIAHLAEDVGMMRQTDLANVMQEV